MIDIYKHTSKTSGKSYIGYSTKGMEERWRGHVTKANGGSNAHFHRAINKYGTDDFTHEIIARCSCLESAKRAEITAIDYYGSFRNGYNMTEGGEGSHGYTHSPETIKKMKEKFKDRANEEYRKKQRDAHLGKKHTEESKKLISDATKGSNNGFFGQKHSEETLKQMKKSAKTKQRNYTTCVCGRSIYNSNLKRHQAVCTIIEPEAKEVSR